MNKYVKHLILRERTDVHTEVSVVTLEGMLKLPSMKFFNSRQPPTSASFFCRHAFSYNVTVVTVRVLRFSAVAHL